MSTGPSAPSPALGTGPALPGGSGGPHDHQDGDTRQSGDKPTIELDEATTRWLEYIRACDAQIKELEESRKRARQHVEAALGEHEVGLVDGRPAVRWTYVHSHRLDQRKLKEQAPELVEQCTVPTVTRRFSLGGDS